MAKTDWQMGDTVQPDDMNQIGQEINENKTIAQDAQQAANDANQTAEHHASRHATGGEDELTPAMIGAETPAGAQDKADAAKQAAIDWANAENVTLIDPISADVDGGQYPLGVTAFQVNSDDGYPNQGTVLNINTPSSFRFTQIFTRSSTGSSTAGETYIRTWRSDSGWSDFRKIYDDVNLPHVASTDLANVFTRPQSIQTDESNVFRIKRTNLQSNVAVQVTNMNDESIYFGMRGTDEFAIGSSTSLSNSWKFRHNVATGRTEIAGDLIVDGVDLKQSVSSGKDAIATAITDMGVPADGSETFASLANKITQIETGKRWASGTGTTTGTTGDFEVRGLDFRPSIVLVETSGVRKVYWAGMSAELNETSYTFADVARGMSFIIYDDGFKSSLDRPRTPVTFSWIAFE